jgi:outer membrane biosynthesis protein TonB
MSIVIALITVLIAGALIANFYPKPNKPTLAEGEILTPDPIEEPTPEVVETPIVEAPKMAAKPKKKPQPKKKPTKKIDA